jgi:hypothetical protein
VFLLLLHYRLLTSQPPFFLLRLRSHHIVAQA